MSTNPEVRLVKHLQKHSGFTARAKDWKIVYQENFSTKPEALEREKQIKNWKSKAMAKNLLVLSSVGSEHPDFTSGGSGVSQDPQDFREI